MEERSRIGTACAAAAGVLLAEAVRESGMGIVFPLAASWLGARCARPSAVWLSRRLSGRCGRIPEKTFCAAYAVFLCAALAYLTAVLSGKIAEELWLLAAELPDAAEEAAALLSEWYGRLPAAFRRIFPGEGSARSFLREAASAAGRAAASFLAAVLAQTVQRIPDGLIAGFVTAAGFVTLTADPKGAERSILSILPEKTAEKAARLYGAAADAVFAYGKAYGTLLLLTFGELSAGLALLGVPNALAGALIAALADALPAVGCGIVLVPWAGWLFLRGEIGRAAGMLALSAAVWLVRQFAEPGIVGKAAGLSAFASLACLFAGWKLGGVGGMILAPVIAGAAARVRSAEKIGAPSERENG